MSINPEIRDQAYQFFIEEAPELLQEIETGLLTLRQERTTAKVHAIMRAAHSIKGGAASVELDLIKTLAHRLEDIFKALYSEAVDIDTELESLLLQAFDCLRLPLMEQINRGSFDAEVAQSLAFPVLDQIEERLGDHLDQVDSFLPSSSDLGIDMVTSIFEVDVAEGLERLTQVLAAPQDYEVAGELRAQAEVFAGFGELLGLSGFEQIAKTALTALDNHQARPFEIGQLLLTDCRAARDAVLAGDRAQGGEPCAALIVLAGTAPAPSPGLSCLDDTPEVSAATADFDLSAWTDFAQSLAEEISQITESAAEMPSLDNVFGTAAEAIDEQPSFELPLDEVFALAVEALADRADPDTSLEAEIPSLNAVLGRLADSTEQDKAEVLVKAEVEAAPETIDAAIESIAQIFEHLPMVEDLPALAAEAPDNWLSSSTARSDSALPTEAMDEKTHPLAKAISTTPRLSIRVDQNRLERMNNLVGELAINRNGLSLQNEQLQAKVKELLERFARFQLVAGSLRELSDLMLIAPDRYGNNQFLSARQSSVARLDSGGLTDDRVMRSEFDSLEMDSYGTMYSLLQGLLEEMMQVEETVDDVVLFARQSDQTIAQQRQMLTNLRDELMWARMLPLGEVLNRFPRVLRDLSASYSKPVSLKLTGTGVLVDRAALEKLYDPLLHLLRNAFDHGIEPAEVRRQQGKLKEGTIEIRAYHQGNQTFIEVTDDGQGLNLEKIGSRAVDKGLVSPQQLAVMLPGQISNFIFEPGFSTAERVSELSGRGVGLDVVRSQLEELKGTITVTFSPGKGTTFTLRLPLTLTIAKLLVGLSGSTAFAFPSDSIEEILIPQADQIKRSGNQQFLYWRQQIIPTYRLLDLLDYSCPLPDAFSSKALGTVPTPQDWAAPLLLLRRGQQLFALEVERLVAEQELAIKPFGLAIAPPSYIYGCTVLADGTLIPVINGAVLLDQVLGQETKTATTTSRVTATASGPETAALKISQASTVLVVDDSATLRRTVALTLERAGYRVLQARDGREALEQLQQSTGVKLVICDIEMPNMNGFEFLSQRRRDEQLRQIPVAMLTSRSNDKHRRLAMQLGADAYFTKPYIEQEFVKAIRQMVIEEFRSSGV